MRCRALALLAGGLAVAPAGAQQPSFDVETSVVTVDVVVLDEAGQPVRGLTRADFSVLENGEPQALTGFEARELPPVASVPALAAAHTENIASNEEARPGRTFAVLFDDLGLSAAGTVQARSAIGDWLRRESRLGDDVTLATTSGEVWWNDRAGVGLDHLLAALGKVEGRRVEAGSLSRMSDWEAARIASDASPAEFMAQASGDGSRPSGAVLDATFGVRLTGVTVLDRVTQRWFDQQVCFCVPEDTADTCAARCKGRVVGSATDQYALASRRQQTLLEALGRLSRGFAGIRGRKSILLVSDSLPRDSALEAPLRRAVDAAQQSNTAVYFLRAEGLRTGGSGAAEVRIGSRSQDLLMEQIEEVSLVTAGAVDVAERTGGVALPQTNDLAAGLDRLALDASAYYLLGYQPSEPPDGRWRKLEVRLVRPGFTLRARPGYLAATAAERARDARQASDAPVTADDSKAPTRPLPPQLFGGGTRSGLPLRLAAYVREPLSDLATARVQLVLEVDNSRVQVDRGTEPWKAALDLTVVTLAPDRRPEVPLDERLTMSLGPKELGGWWLMTRDLRLPPGTAQVRALVRDVASGESGLAVVRVRVPDLEKPYLSSPLCTNRTRPPARPGEEPRLVPAAHRTFEARGDLYCQFEVNSFAGQMLRGLPRLRASYELRGPEGWAVSSARPTRIRTEGKYAVRRIVVPMDDLKPGPYVLVLRVEDELAGSVMATQEHLMLEAPAPAPGESTRPGAGGSKRAP